MKIYAELWRIQSIEAEIKSSAITQLNPETTSGGRALAFYASVRINVRVGDQIKVKDDVIGHVVKCKITKNKTYPPFKEADFTLFYGQGMDRVSEIADLSIRTGFVKQGGAWFSMVDDEGNVRTKGDIQLKWQGKDNFVAYLRTDEDLVAELEQKLRGQDS